MSPVTGYVFDLAKGIHTAPNKIWGVTAIVFCLCLAIHCGQVVQCHSPHAAMSPGCHLLFPRPPTEEGLLHAMPQLPFPVLTVPSLSLSKLRKHPSSASTPPQKWLGIC